MIRLARQTDYAARLVLHLASLGENQSASIAEIAAQRLLPVPFVRRMVAELVAAGILKSTRGSKGGVQLGRPAKDISLADLVQAMEGPIALNDCVHEERACPFSGDCPVQKAWAGASASLAEHLSTIRFDALVNAGDGHAAAHAALNKSSPRRPTERRGSR